MKCTMLTREFVGETHLSATNESDGVEVAYRNCLRREAGMVGVVNINQMRKCELETGYGK